jgi:hypothetical protein
MNLIRCLVTPILAALLAPSLPLIARAESAEPVSALAKMPVQEITVFKDGHAFVLHEGDMPTDRAGDVVMDYLPSPVLGTFWPFSDDKDALLVSTISSKHRVAVHRTALALADLLEANPGAEVHIAELSGTGERSTVINYDGVIVGVPTRSSEELEKTSPPNEGEKLPEKGNILLVKTADGIKAVPLNHVETVSFKDEHKAMLASEEFRNLLTLHLQWAHNKASDHARVGLMYLQNGIRWIPQYKLVLDDSGRAKVKLQATLINELTDLNDVTTNLVVGVPTFAFRDQIDPISIQETMASLSPGLAGATNGTIGPTASLSNVIMTQAALPPPPLYSTDGSANGETAPVISGSTQNEDLFVYTVKHISLRKGQRMVIPMTEFELPFKDIYTLDLPITPPQEVCQYTNVSQAQAEKLLNAPKVLHTISLKNNSQYPLTTAPVLIIHNDRILAQGTMTYASQGSDEKIDITAAVDVRVKKSDKETGRFPNAVKWQNNFYGRVDLEGTIGLTNLTKKPISLEITRRVLGKVSEADHQGSVKMMNVLEEEGSPVVFPAWWNYGSWPFWWHQVNSIGKITWKPTLEPGKSIDLGYTCDESRYFADNEPRKFAGQKSDFF